MVGQGGQHQAVQVHLVHPGPAGGGQAGGEGSFVPWYGKAASIRLSKFISFTLGAHLNLRSRYSSALKHPGVRKWEDNREQKAATLSSRRRFTWGHGGGAVRVRVREESRRPPRCHPGVNATGGGLYQCVCGGGCVGSGSGLEA